MQCPPAASRQAGMTAAHQPAWRCCNGRRRRRALSLPALPLLLLLLLAAGTASGQAGPPAAQSVSAAACGVASLELLPSACGVACRAASLDALVAIYRQLRGPSWNFDISQKTTNSGGWLTCPFPRTGGCRADSAPTEAQAASAGEVLPSYCCWEGVFCCHEHTVLYTSDASTNDDPCSRYSVVVLQLRGINATNSLTSVWGPLQVLNRYGLAALDMSRNELTGSLPPDLSKLTNLQALLLGSNNITGSVPASLAKMPQLAQLDLEFNFLTGTLAPQQLCPPGGALSTLMLRANDFSGSLDLRGCGNLTVVDLQDNAFRGPVPVGAPNRLLHVLRARNNFFSGPIPPALWELRQLITVDFTNNMLTGSLAQTTASANFLTTLLLGGNHLRGTIPAGLTTSSQLTNLDLSNNAWLVGTIPSMKWMLGLQTLDLSNTRVRGPIPPELGSLPFLMSVDLRNTLMTCCSSLQQAQAANDSSRLLPPFLQFNAQNKHSPVDEHMPNDPFLRSFMATGEDMLCDTVMRRPNTNPGNSSVHRPADLSGQQWHIDPEYYWFMHCFCAPDFTPARNESIVEDLWCEAAASYRRNLSPEAANSSHSCMPMSVQVCKPRAPSQLSAWHIVLIGLAAMLLLCLLVMLTSLTLSMCIARTGKVRRQIQWWRKHLAGMPKSGRMSIVVTDIEGYSDLFKRCPEPMYQALTLHNNVIRRAKYTNCGSTVQQEGDSFTLVFHDPFDAVAFCLQVQQGLMEVQWPEGLTDDSSTHSGQQHQQQALQGLKGRSRSKLPGETSWRPGGGLSSLASAPSAWLRKSRSPVIKSSASTGLAGASSQYQPPSPAGSDSLMPAASPFVVCGTAAGDQHAGAASGPLPPSSSLALRGSHAAMSKARMMDLFQRMAAVSSGGGGGEAALFHGLRVRMGIVSGHVEGPAEPATPSANIMNSALYKLAVDVSDAGNGGQVLMDEATFKAIKEDLRPLGAVGPGGINFNRLAQRTSLFHLLCLGALFTRRRSGRIDVDEACVLDMGCFELPAGAGAKRGPQQPNLAGMMFRASMRMVTLGHYDAAAPQEQQEQTAQQQTPTHAQQQQQLQEHHARISSIPDGEFYTAMAAASSLPGAMPADLLHFLSGQQQQQQQHASGGVSPRFGQQHHQQLPPPAPAHAAARGGTGAGAPPPQRLRLLQVLPPGLVGRAHVWGNRMAIKSTWLCVDAPYFEAPGALEAPLACQLPLNRSGSMGGQQSAAVAAAAGGSSGSSFVSTASGGQRPQSPPGAATAEQQQQLQLVQLRGGSSSSDGYEVTSPSAAAPSPARARTAAVTVAVGVAVGDGPVSSARPALRCLSIKEEAVSPSGDSDTAQQQREQQCVITLQGASPAAAAGGSQQQQQLQQAAAEAAADAAAAAVAVRLLRQPIPPVTMVFTLVEGAKVFGQRKKQLLKEVHGQLSLLLMEALRHVPGGYMCRMQEGDLKYMAAFSSARGALEWCLTVQEAALCLNWPPSWNKVAQLRAEYDECGALLFRGPRLKMGVCEGEPQTIIPSHEGRADYHGASINASARFMDAAAHGGQVACEKHLALAVLQEWGQLQQQDQEQQHQQQQQASAGSDAPALGQQPVADAAAAPQQHGVSPFSCAAAAPAVSASSGVLPPVILPGSSNSPPEQAAAGGGRARPLVNSSSRAGGGVPHQPAAAPALSSSASSSHRLAKLFHKAGSKQQLVGGGGGDSDASQHGADAAQADAAAAAAPAAADPQQPRVFGLADVPRGAAGVRVYELGLYKFKGSPQPLEMVDVTLAALAGRQALYPPDPPKGKGNRVAAREGLVAACEAAQLPLLSQAYRARVPPYILNGLLPQPADTSPAGSGRGGGTGAAGAPVSPRRQIVAALRSASMPAARSYSRMQHSFGGGGSSSGSRALPASLVALQQQYNGASAAPAAAASGGLGSNAAEQQPELQLAAAPGSGSGWPPGTLKQGSGGFSPAHSNGSARHTKAAGAGTGDVVLHMADGREGGVARVPGGAAAVAGSG